LYAHTTWGDVCRTGAAVAEQANFVLHAHTTSTHTSINRRGDRDINEATEKSTGRRPSQGEIAALTRRGPALAAPVLHRQVYDRIRSLILGGQLPSGSRLPSTRALAASMSVSRSTILLAFEQLKSEGYLEGRHGSGTYVARALPDELLEGAAVAPREPARQPGSRHLSERGARIASTPRTPLASLSGGPAGRAFQIGLPELDSFPAEQWARLISRMWRRSSRDLMQYRHPAGYGPLRQAIATRIATTRGVRCAADQVVVVTGSQQALGFAARVLLDPGDSVWMEDPGYLGARAALVAAGARLVPVAVDRHGLDVGAAVASDPAARMAVVTPSHQFPLGSTLSLDRRLALIDWASRNDSWVVEDDYDSEFRYVGPPLGALQGIDTESRVIYVGTFSKIMFPALRLGYMVVPPDLVDAMIAAHMSADIHCHILEQAALTDFIEEGHLDRHVRRMRVLYAERQAVLVESSKQKLSGLLEVEPSESGLHLVGWLQQRLDDREVCRDARTNGVEVWPLSLHSMRPVSRGALLMGYAGSTPAEIRVGVERLVPVLGRLADRAQ
jgi:GntR family transcriptional regulator / MocR family aminotransferase